MGQPDELETISRQLLAGLPAEDGTLEDLAAALHAASRRLDDALSPVLGSLGVRLIIERGIASAAGRHPFLRKIQLFEDGVDAHVALEGMSNRDYDLVREGFEAVLSSFTEVLAGLVGRDLAAGLTQRAIPGTERE